MINPNDALKTLTKLLQAEVCRSRAQAEVLDDIERQIAKLVVSCAAHVAEARQHGRRDGIKLAIRIVTEANNTAASPDADELMYRTLSELRTHL